MDGAGVMRRGSGAIVDRAGELGGCNSGWGGAEAAGEQGGGRLQMGRGRRGVEAGVGVNADEAESRRRSGDDHCRAGLAVARRGRVGCFAVRPNPAVAGHVRLPHHRIYQAGSQTRLPVAGCG